eukprot:2607687-Prorocentrum_lima.AAC.1
MKQLWSSSHTCIGCSRFQNGATIRVGIEGTTKRSINDTSGNSSSVHLYRSGGTASSSFSRE